MIVHILKMCTSYFVHVSFFFILRGVELRHFFSSEMLRGCLVCVKSVTPTVFIPFIFILYIMIVNTLKMCTSHFVHLSFFSNFWRVLNIDIFPSEMLRGYLVSVI